MQRVTLEKEYPGSINMRFGYEEVVPLYMGPQSQDVTTEFRGARTPLPAKPRIWTMDWKDPEQRSALCPNEVLVHYFGDPRSALDDNELVRAKVIPSYNNERTRVAMVWGDFEYTHRRAYDLTKIAVPKMPHVVIHNVNANGSTVGDWAWRPWEFWKFEEMLAEDAAEQMAELHNKRRKVAHQIDISSLTPEQLREIAAAVSAISSKKVPA